MKKVSLYVLIASVFYSCSVLEVEPTQAISDATTVIVDGNSAEKTILGAYNRLGSNSYYGLQFPAMVYLSGDNIQWTGSWGFLTQFSSHDILANNQYPQDVWEGIYSTINVANNVIGEVPSVQDVRFTQAQKDRIVGEAYFIRALCYFDLVRTFGGVQLILTPTRGPEDNQGIKRSSVEATYQQVLADLTQAENLLPNEVNRNRATKKTAWALKARYYLYQKDWTMAVEYASKLIGDNSNYQLIAPYGSFFLDNAINTPESIFEINYTASFTNAHSSWWANTGGGRREWAPGAELINLLKMPTVGGNRYQALVGGTEAIPVGKMYYRNPGTDPAFVLRIAEQYLIRAEAYAQLDLLDQGVEDLNAVRERAGLSPLTPTSKEELLLAIEQERRLEFAYEPHRWFDLIRTGRAQEVLNIADARKLVFPIPYAEVLIDPALEQNDGY